MLKPAMLTEALAKVCPVEGIDCKGDSLVRIRYKEGATEDQKRLAQEVAQAFDWSKPEQKPEAPLTDDEIRWVREQMKAKVDAIR